MAKPLVFRVGDSEFSFSVNKVDRSKLYGYKETEVLDDDEHKCELATLADDGRTVIGRGGTGLGYLSADGDWCEKAQLQPVDLEGNEIIPVTSSFAAPIELEETATLDEYLDHNIRLIYVLSSEDDVGKLNDNLNDGTIYKFPYSYRGGLEADVGFLLIGDDANIFLAVGNPTNVEFIGLQQTAAILDEEGKTEETDLMDFDMI